MRRIGEIGLLLAVAAVLIASMIVIDGRLPGAGKWAATLLGGVVLLIAVGYLIDWIAERIIGAIDWMTRWER